MENECKWIDRIDHKKYAAPFVIKYDKEYLSLLEKKLNDFVKDLSNAKAPIRYIKTVKRYKKGVLVAIKNYYKGDIYQAQNQIDELVKGCLKSEVAVSNINNNIAFRGTTETEVQFFRARLNNAVEGFSAKEMLHIPFDMRERVKSERFSIPGLPCLYLGNTSYVCWIEMGRPADHQFNVSPVILDNEQNVFNLTVSVEDIYDFENVYNFVGGESLEDALDDYLKLIVLMIATSYRVEQDNRNFKSEYIISQLIMLSCKAQGIDGVTFYSKQVSHESFARVVGVNLALFATYNEDEKLSEICEHVEIDDSFNFAMYKQLLPSLKCKYYELRINSSSYIKNIGTFKRQFPYRETEFYEFDKYLFANWDKKNT